MHEQRSIGEWTLGRYRVWLRLSIDGIRQAMSHQRI